MISNKYIILIALCLVSIIPLEAQEATIDKNKWENSIKYRKSIVKRSETKKILVGKTKAEIINILGEPEKKHEDTYIYCVTKELVLIVNCDAQKEDCLACNSSYLAVIFVNNLAIDVLSR